MRMVVVKKTDSVSIMTKIIVSGKPKLERMRNAVKALAAQQRRRHK